jgi:hypothetical protein
MGGMRSSPRRDACLVPGLVGLLACSPSIVPTEGDADGSATSGPTDPPATTGPGATSIASASSAASTGQDESATDGRGGTSTGGAGSTSTGVDTSAGEVGSSSDSTGSDEEVVCLDPNAGIAWAGDWGKWWGPACMYTAGVPEPVVVDATGFGNDCTILTADVWIPGVTDVDGNEALIRCRVVIEDLAGVPVEEMYVPGVGFNGRFGNNYRYWFNFQSGGWIYVPLGTYQYRFQFSYLEENEGCWYTIGLGDGPDGGAPRTLIWQS